MGKAIDMTALAETVAQYGFAYLITVGDGARIHTSAVHPVVADAALTIPGITAHSLANTAKNPSISLVWPPTREGGYSLIVDGEANAPAEPDAVLRVTPSRAVLHRPAPRPESGTGAGTDAGADADSGAESGAGCRSDCAEL